MHISTSLALGTTRRAAGGGAWTPAQIESLHLWIDFSQQQYLYQDAEGTTPVAADSDPIGRAVGRNGDAVVTQATSNRRPIFTEGGQNGGAVATFDGGDWLRVAAFAAQLTQPYALVVVANIGGVSQFVAAGGDVIGNHAGLLVNVGDRYYLYAGTSFDTGVSRAAGYHLFTARFAGANSHLRIDGRQYNGNPGSGSLQGLTVGASYNDSAPLVGSIKHVLLFDGTLSPHELSLLEGYFNSDTGLDTYSDHKFQIGGDAGYVAGFDPVRRIFWRFGADDTDKSAIQWVNIDTWVSGKSKTPIPTAGGFAVWHPPTEKFYIYGGRGNGTWPSVDNVYSFDPVSETLTLLSESLPAVRAASPASLYPGDNKIYIFGGITDSTTTHSNIWVHDPVAGTITDTGAVLPANNSNMGAVWAEDVGLFFLVGGYDGDSTSPDAIVTYDPSTPATNAVDTGETISLGLENQACAYVDGRIYAINGYNRDTTSYSTVIHKITTSPVAVSTLAETGHRADDDAVAFYDSVTSKIYAGPFIHSSQATDNHGPDKRVIYEFDPATETLAAEPSLT